MEAASAARRAGVAYEARTGLRPALVQTTKAAAWHHHAPLARTLVCPCGCSAARPRPPRAHLVCRASTPGLQPSFGAGDGELRRLNASSSRGGVRAAFGNQHLAKIAHTTSGTSCAAMALARRYAARIAANVTRTSVPACCSAGAGQRTWGKAACDARRACSGVGVVAPPADIAVIDVAPFVHGSPAEQQAVAEQVAKACETIGFFGVTGHGVPDAVVRAAWDEAWAFFDRVNEGSPEGTCGGGNARPAVRNTDTRQWWVLQCRWVWLSPWTCGVWRCVQRRGGGGVSRGNQEASAASTQRVSVRLRAHGEREPCRVVGGGSAA